MEEKQREKDRLDELARKQKEEDDANEADRKEKARIAAEKEKERLRKEKEEEEERKRLEREKREQLERQKQEAEAKKGAIKEETDEEDLEEEEGEESEIGSAPPQAEKPAEPPRPQIDRKQLEVARNELSLLFDKHSTPKERTYVSSNCVIRSIFDHPLDEVNKSKNSRLTEAKEEVSDNIRELLKSLNLQFDKPINESSLTAIQSMYLQGLVDS